MKGQNFPDDPLLRIKHVKFKVRDLALSNFNPSYAAFDLHVTRVVARIGLLAYGWEVTGDTNLDFGTNPSDNRNYLFLHRLFVRMSELCGGLFTPVDLDRVFWHLGRCTCGATAECARCPIRGICLTGQQKTSNKEVHGTGTPRRGLPNGDLCRWRHSMRQSGLRGCAPRRRRVLTTDSRHRSPVAPNLEAQDFTAAAPNRVWVADITYIGTEEGWLAHRRTD